MTKIKCMLCGMVLEEEDYSIPLMRPRKGMDEQPDFFEGICQSCKKSIDRAIPEEDDNNKNNTRIC